MFIRSLGRYEENLFLFKILHKPIHIIGQSRIDTWQKYQTPIPSSKSRIIHHPIQIEGKSRIDTWQRTTSRRRAFSATEVRFF
jgi:hypothetical protein